MGLNINVARMLAYLQNVDKATSVEIERSTGLCQPEVSIAMKRLKEHGWIDEREAKKPGRGRPFKIYSLKVGFNEIVAQLEKNKGKKKILWHKQ